MKESSSTSSQELKLYFASSQTVFLFLPHLTDGTTWIYFLRKRKREREIYENSHCYTPQPGFKLTPVELAPLFVGP